MNKKRILVAEDDGILAAHLEDLLKGLGYAVVGPVAKGENAFPLAAADLPDLVLMDIELAGSVNGVEAAAAIQAAHDIPIVYLTGYSQDPLIQLAKRTSPYGYLVKPVLERELAATIEMSLQRHALDHELKEREAELRTLVANVPGAVYRCELEAPWRMTEMSAGVSAVTGWRPEDFLTSRKTWAEIVYPEDLPEVERAVARGVQEGRPFSLEYRVICADGLVRWVQESGRCVYDAQGRPRHLDGVILDIDERRQAERSIENANSELAAIYASVPVALLLLGEDRRVCKANTAAVEASGLKAGDLIGLRAGEALRCLNALDDPRGCGFSLSCEECPIRQAEERAFSNGTNPENIEAWLPVDAGMGREERCLQISATHLRYDGESKVLVSAQDITERKRAEAALRAERAELQAVYDHAPTMMCVLDQNRNFLYANSAFSRFVGGSSENLRQQSAGGALGCINALEDVRGCGHGKECESCALRLAMLSTLATGTEHRDVEYRATLLNGTARRDVILLGSTSLIQTGGEARLLLCLADITDREAARKSLKESEEKYRAVVENAGEAIIVAQDGHLRFANKRAAEITGYPIDELLRMPFGQWIHAGDRETVDSRHYNRQSGIVAPDHYEFRIVHSAGTVRWVSLSAVRTEWEGTPATLGFLTDITTRRQLEADYHSLFENMLDGFAVHQIILGDEGEPADYRFLAVNPAFEAMTGLRADRVVGRTAREVLPGIEPEWIGTYANVAASGEPVRFQDYSLDLDKWFEVYAFCVAPGQFATVFQDITERRKAEQSLKLSEERYRQVSSAISDVAYACGKVADGGYEIDWLTGATESVTGYTTEELIGLRSWGKLVVEEDRDAFERNVSRLSPGEARSCELRIRRKDGTIHWISSSAECVPAPNGGSAPRVFGGLTDITERKLAEERYKAVWDRSIDPMRLTDKDGTIVQVNEAFSRMVGIPRENLEGSLFTCIYRESDRDEALRGYLRRMAARAFQSHMARKMTLWDGREIWFDTAVGVLDTGQGPMVLSVLRETTQRKEMEESLRRSEERFAQVAEQSMEMIWEVDAEGGYTYVSEACNRLLGYAPEEIAGKFHYHDLVAEESREEFSARWRQITGRQGTFSNVHKRMAAQDGRRLDVVTSAVPMLDKGGQLVGYRGADRDITEQKQAEERLAQAQKMESVGRLAGGVAHDFNNLLTVINGYSELILSKLKQGDPLKDGLEQIKKAGDRAARLTQQLLAFSRKQVLQPQALNLNDVIQEMRPMLERLMGEDIRIRLELCPENALLSADPHQIEQVIMNLAVNARDAMPKGGRLLLKTYLAQVGEGPRASQDGEAAGHHCVLEVGDDGEGMDDATRLRIFEPFFTTKEVGKGTGLGLSMVQGIVKQSNGFIDVRSNPGRGSTFLIYLPVTNANPESPVKQGPSPIMRGDETILVVEDESEVRRFGIEVLRSFGYRVIEASGAGEALAIVERSNDRIDLLVTDVVMPLLNGRELASRLRRVQPGLKVLYMSGYAEPEVSPRELLSEGTGFIGKPFGPEQLAAKVRTMLGQKGGRGRILVIDDDVAVRAFLKEVLRRPGYDVLDASGGNRAIRILKDEHVDLVLTDLIMPDGEGLETIRTLSKDFGGIPVIAMSGAFDGQFLATAKLLGAEAILRKPIDSAVLLAKVAEIMDSD